MADHEPDEKIDSIKIVLHTASVSNAGTDSDIFLELFDKPPALDSMPGPFVVELDTSGKNDFETGATDVYHLPAGYFQGRIVNDIRRVRLYKGDDLGSDWGFGWISVFVNGDELWTSPGSNLTWLTDGDTWTGKYTPVPFTDPVIETAGLPDADSDTAYNVTFKARGGRKKLAWAITAGSGNAFVAAPKITAANADGTEAVFSAKTVKTNSQVSWTGTVRVTDADGRMSEKQVEMRVVFTLPAPTVAGFTPVFGWPGEETSDLPAVMMTITSSGKDFDSRTPDATRVLFNSGTLEAQSVPGGLTSSQVTVRVPKGAASGLVSVKTAFGVGSSSTKFIAHRSGYRFVNGFSFVNRVDDSDGTDGFPDTFHWGRFEETFGLDEMWITTFDQAICPNPIATSFFIMLHDTIDNGCCHGFGLASLQPAKGIVPISPLANDERPYPLDDSLWELSKPGRPLALLSRLVQSRQLTMFSDEAFSYYLQQIDDTPNVFGLLCTMDGRPAVADLESALSTDFADPRMLAFARNCALWEGHVVVPYALEHRANVTDVRVYNPNEPGDPNSADDPGSVIWVRPADGLWGFEWTENVLWDGIYMFTIPLSAYGHQYDWSIPGFGSFMDLLDAFVFGCAGTDSGGDIAQVTDPAGRSLFDQFGNVHADRTTWPASARQVPTLGRGGQRRRLVALTGQDPLSYTIRPRRDGTAGSGQPTAFTMVRGADHAVGVEEITVPHAVRYLPAEHVVEVAPTEKRSDPIVRVARRFPDSCESFNYAVRARQIDSSTPVRVGPSQDGRGIVIRLDAVALTFDVEVTHTDRTGRQRVIEHGGLLAAAGSTATLSLPDPDEIDRASATPLVLVIDDGNGSVTTRRLGHRPAGPDLVLPHRIVARPKIPPTTGDDDPWAVRQNVHIDVSRCTSSSPGGTLQFEVRDDKTCGREGDRLVLPLPSGTHPVRIVATDGHGKRSFPRTVYVSIAEPGERVVPPKTMFGDNVVVEPGTSATVPLGVYVVDQPTSKVTAVLSARHRRSGTNTARPRLLAPFSLGRRLREMGATVVATQTVEDTNLTLEISWDPGTPLSGRIDLGRLTVEVPEQVSLGSTFLIKGEAQAVQQADGTESGYALNVLPTVVKVWGGPEPRAVELTGPERVGEGEEVQAAVVGPAGGATNIGWWVEGLGGLATVEPDPAHPVQATVTGHRAGRVRLTAVVGGRTTSRLLVVTPTVKPGRFPLRPGGA